MSRRACWNRCNLAAVTLVAGILATASEDAFAQAVHDNRLSGAQRTGAAVVSATLGLGFGHNVIGYDDLAWRYRWTQAAGFTAGVVGFFSLWNDCDSAACLAGPALFVAGSVLYVGSRVWEFVDVLARPVAHNARIDRQKQLPTGPASAGSLHIVPIVQRERLGVGATIKF